MTVLELNTLVKTIEEKWGVSAAAVAVVSTATAAVESTAVSAVLEVQAAKEATHATNKIAITFFIVFVCGVLRFDFKRIANLRQF